MARRAVSRSVSSIRRERIDWLDPGRIAFGEITIVAGRQGLGKSQYLCLQAARISTGEIGGTPGHVLIAAAEDDPATTLKPRLEAVGADLARIEIVEISITEGSDGLALLSLPRDLPTLEELIAENQSRAVFFDPLLSHLDESVDSFKDQAVRKTLAPLSAIARRQRTAILTSFHLNKRDGVDVLQRITAAGAFTQVARSVFLFARDPDDPDGDRGNRRALSHEKSNLGPEMPTQLYVVEPILLPARADTGEPEVTTSRLRLAGESNRNGKDMLGATGSDEQSALDEAIAFLRRELEEETLCRDVQRAARELGIAPITLKRAKLKLGVLSRKTDSRLYAWRLPQPLTLLDHPTTGVDDPPSDDPPLDFAQPSGFEGSEGSSDTQVDHVGRMIHLGQSDAESALLAEADELVREGVGRWAS